MAITAYNSTYRDDINIPDSNGLTPLDKNYLRILFKPGFAVQTRELNQLQSMIQSQLDHMGESIFRSGKPVIDGISQFDDTTKIYSVDVTLNAPLVGSFSYDVIKTTGSDPLSASIIKTKTLSTNSYRLYIKSNDAQSTSGVNKFKFIENDSVVLASSSSNITSEGSVTAVNLAVGAHVNKGVYFTKGCYVVVDEQYAVSDLIESTTKFSGYVVLKIEENAVSAVGGANPDETLLDNATGSLNYAAAGADRYSITLTLSLQTEIPADNDYITLLTVRNDVIIVDNSIITASGIDDKLAQRTYEESGDYEVNPFPIHILEAYNDGTEVGTGMYLEADLIQNGYSVGGTTDPMPDIAAAKKDLVVKLDPSVAYVKGYRVELKSSIPMPLPKARTFSPLKPSAVSANMGVYVDGSFANESGVRDIQNVGLIYDIYDTAESSYYFQQGGKIGTARIRSIEYISGSTYRIFLYDINLNSGSTITPTAYLENIESGQDDFRFNIATSLNYADVQDALFKLPMSPVNTIEDVTFSKKNTYEATASDDKVTISIDSEKAFDKSVTNLIVYNITSQQIITASNIVIDNTPSNVLSFSAGNFIMSGDQVTVITTVSSLGQRGTKTLKTSTVRLDSLYAEGGGVYTLPNVWHLVEVLSGTDVNATLSSDYTIVSDGQNPTHYSEAKVKYNVSGALGNKKITYSYFEFGNTEFDFFDSTSYFYQNPSTGADVQMELEDIPNYKSTALRDVLDFRYYDIENVLANPIDPYSAITFDASYYLPRVDNVLVNQAGNFYVNRGIPSDNPQKPKTPDGAMELYTLTVAPYTFGPDDVIVEKVDNQRYTMSNIRAIDKRVANLEYYTTLSLLEKSAKDTILYADDGIERFKNGFVVDNFAGHNVGDPADPDYICSIDADNNELRPAFSINSLKLSATDTSEVAVHDRSITLPYTTVPYISQTFGSDTESVNPYNVSTFVGKLKLYPTADYWCDTKQRPNLVIKDNALKDAIRYFANNIESQLAEDGLDIQILGTEWGSWDTYWSGKEKRTELSKSTDRTWYGKKTTSYKYEVEKDVKQSRDGIKTTVGTAKTSELNLGKRVVDVSVRPYIRQRYVYFHAHSLKPNTIYYPFFDSKNVGPYCYKKSALTIDKKSDIASRNGGPIPVPRSTNKVLRSDSRGSLYGLFVIPDPSKTGLKFMTGTRQFTLSDSPNNISSEVTSFANANYIASGLAKVKQKSILSTAIPEVVRTNVKDNRSTTETKISTSKKTCWLDPIAQSFLISNPEGIFATGVDLYFSRVPSTDTASVEMFIVTCENGIPTQDVVPLTTVSKNVTEVTPNDYGRIATYFEFEQPVYLTSGQEYAIICTSVDSDYRVFIATLGGKDVDSKKLISVNPYNGVFFKSQNSSTWSPDQSKDLKFRLHRAKFSTSDANVQFKTFGATRVQSIKVTNGGSGYTAVPNVTISGGSPTIAASATAVISGGAVTEILLNTTEDTAFAIQGGEGYLGTPTITVGPPTSGNTATAEAVMYNIGVSSFVLDQDTVEISAVDEENPSQIIQSGVSNQIEVLRNSYQVEPNITYDASLSKRSWDADGVNNNNTVNLVTRLYTTSDYLSPVIDTDRLNVKLIRNRILSVDAKTSRYITRNIPLASSANQLDIYFDINRPSLSCDVEVYAKFINPGVSESEWIVISRLTPITIPTNTNPYEFSELHYVDERSLAFTEFKIKIVFKGSNIVDVPRIKNFRAIATIH